MDPHQSLRWPRSGRQTGATDPGGLRPRACAEFLHRARPARRRGVRWSRQKGVIPHVRPRRTEVGTAVAFAGMRHQHSWAPWERGHRSEPEGQCVWAPPHLDGRIRWEMSLRAWNRSRLFPRLDSPPLVPGRAGTRAPTRRPSLERFGETNPLFSRWSSNCGG